MKILRRFFYSFLDIQQRYIKLSAMAHWNVSDVYLVSYPKSGVTWVCLIIANILKEMRDDCRRVDFLSVHDYVPDLHSNPERILQISPPRVIKSHEKFEDWYQRIGIRGKKIIFPRVIYLIRDGREALISYYHYLKALNGYNNSFSKFIKDGSFKRGDWADHVSQWIIHNKHLDKKGVLLIKYEDLCKNAFKEIKKISEFIGIEVSDEILESAIKEADIVNIRVYEKKYGSGVKYSNTNYRFAKTSAKKDYEAANKALANSYFDENIDTFKFFGYK